jgi:hypothetical protein
MSGTSKRTADPRAGPGRLYLFHRIVRRAAIALSCQHAGAVAFARTGDPATSEFQDRVVLAHFGDTSMSYSRLFQTLR